MRVFATLLTLGVVCAHRMMITFNCQGLPGIGMAVQDVPEDCSDAVFYEGPIKLNLLRTLTKTNAAKSGHSMQYLAGNTEANMNSFDLLEELDSAVASSLLNGSKVVLLGPEISLRSSESDGVNIEKDIDRRPLQAAPSKSTGWSDVPSKAVAGCGIIKIGTSFKVGDKTGELDSVDKWQCDSGKWTLPTKDGKNLEISFTKGTGAKAALANMVVAYDGDTFQDSDLPYGSDKPVFSYLCSKKELLKSGTKTKLTMGPYQIQPFNTDNKFSKTTVDCVPLMGELVWATFLGFLLFSTILGGAVWAMLAIESPTRFETPRSKPLIIPDVQ